MKTHPPLHRQLSLAVIALILLFVFQGVLVSATAAVVAATYNSGTDVPMTAGSYTATGDTVSFTLNYTPVTGTT